MPALLLVLLALPAADQGRPPAPTPAPFTTTLTAAQMANKQAVVETTAGTFVIDLRSDLAPTHVAYFIKLATDGAYNGTVFHRLIRGGIIQGGDPLSKDPAKASQYGIGGLGVLKAEHSAEHHTRGSVSAVIRSGQPDSAGSQFFICVTDQPALDGQYTIFGRVSDGLDVVQKISEMPADSKGVPEQRIEMTSVTIRDAPAAEPVPFSTETPAQLGMYRAVLETSAGAITIGFLPEKAPETVRQFLRLAQAGVFDGTSFHRVVRGFAIQTGYLATRGPLSERQQKLVHNLAPEFNDTKHVKGVVSMARGDDPASATTSFFIVTFETPSLDGKYTAFGRVVDGLDVVDTIERTPVNGEAPAARIDLIHVRVVKQGPGGG